MIVDVRVKDRDSQPFWVHRALGGLGIHSQYPRPKEIPKHSVHDMARSKTLNRYSCPNNYVLVFMSY